MNAVEACELLLPTRPFRCALYTCPSFAGALVLIVTHLAVPLRWQVKSSGWGPLAFETVSALVFLASLLAIPLSWIVTAQLYRSSHSKRFLGFAITINIFALFALAAFVFLSALQAAALMM